MDGLFVPDFASLQALMLQANCGNDMLIWHAQHVGGVTCQ